jgi:hypothetical protein
MSSSFRLKSSLLFFLDLRFLKGHLDWHIGCLNRLCLSRIHPPRFEAERRTNAHKNDDNRIVLPVARMNVVARLPLLPSSESVRCVILFWMCDDATPGKSGKRCQIKYKMLCSPFAFTDAREKIWDAHFLQSSIQLCAHMYFFDVHVLYVRVICMRCEESKHTNSESCNRRIKRWKYPRISAFLRRLFGKLKDVFFFKAHV